MTEKIGTNPSPTEENMSKKPSDLQTQYWLSVNIWKVKLWGDKWFTMSFDKLVHPDNIEEEIKKKIKES